MKLKNPIVWSVIGASLGFLAAIGGQDSRIIDGLTGALIQGVIWYFVSWIVIKILEKYPIKSSEKIPTKESISSHNISLRLWFLIFYLLPTLGYLSSSWNSASTSYGLPMSSLEKLSNFSNSIFSLAGFIDIFIFPSLASAITITSAIYFYRRSVTKLKNNKFKPALFALFTLATILIWIALSLLVAVLVD